MYRISVLYPNQEGRRFDLEYYLKRHLPLVKSLLEPFRLRDVEVTQGLASGSPQPYLVVTHLVFDELEDFQRGMKENQAMIVSDVPNYTDITPVFQIGRIL